MAVFYDAPMSLSGELARRTGRPGRRPGPEARGRAVPVPERELQDFPGPIATSDTALIDAHDPWWTWPGRSSAGTATQPLDLTEPTRQRRTGRRPVPTPGSPRRQKLPLPRSEGLVKPRFFDYKLTEVSMGG